MSKEDPSSVIKRAELIHKHLLLCLASKFRKTALKHDPLVNHGANVKKDV